MDMNVYQRNARQTAIYPTNYKIPPGTVGLLYTSLGLAGESGEFANKVKKVLRDDDGRLSLERRDQLLDELGDILWYASQVAAELESDLASVALSNLQKLNQRKQSQSLGGSGDAR